MKNLIALFFLMVTFTSCGDSKDDPNPNSDAQLLKFTLNGVEYVKVGKEMGELAFYGKYGEDDMMHYVLEIAGLLNHDASVSFSISSDQTGSELHYNDSNTNHMHNFVIVFTESGQSDGVIYYADNDVTVSITERTLPTTTDNGKIKGTFSGTFNKSIDGIRQEGEETLITGSFNVGY